MGGQVEKQEIELRALLRILDHRLVHAMASAMLAGIVFEKLTPGGMKHALAEGKTPDDMDEGAALGRQFLEWYNNDPDAFTSYSTHLCQVVSLWLVLLEALQWERARVYRNLVLGKPTP